MSTPRVSALKQPCMARGEGKRLYAVAELFSGCADRRCGCLIE